MAQTFGKIAALLPLEKADAIVDKALALGHEHGMNPLTVVVIDTGGHVIVVKREDGCGIMRTGVATGKAYGALGLGIPSRAIAMALADRPTFVNSLSVVSDGRLVPVPGGVLVQDQDNNIIGAVGISGDTSDKDEFCAIEAIKAAGYGSAPAEPAPDWNA